MHNRPTLTGLLPTLPSMIVDSAIGTPSCSPAFPGTTPIPGRLPRATMRDSMPPAPHRAAPASKTAGIQKVAAIVLDDERAAQWSEDHTFRRALMENLADELPTMDQVVVYTLSGTELAKFAPEDYLTSETTARYTRTDVAPEAGAARQIGLPPVTRVHSIPGARRPSAISQSVARGVSRG